jgi:hypothetical protein
MNRVKVFLKHAMQAQSGNRGIAPLILTLNTKREMGGKHHAVATSTPQKEPQYPL